MIYKEKSHIFSLRPRADLLLFSEETIGQQKISAGFLALEEGHLQPNKKVFTYLAKEE